jgi:hypothetical protein
MMNRWCEYQKRSKCARRRFSMAKNTIIPREAVMIQPVIPGPVAKFADRNAIAIWPTVFASGSAFASLPKLTMCATTCTTVQKTMDQAVAL